MFITILSILVLFALMWFVSPANKLGKKIPIESQNIKLNRRQRRAILHSYKQVKGSVRRMFSSHVVKDTY